MICQSTMHDDASTACCGAVRIWCLGCIFFLLGRLSGYATQVQSLKPMAAAAGVGSGQEKKSRLSFISTFQGRYNFV